MNKLGIFYSSVSNHLKYPNKTLLMDNFKHGAELSDTTIIEYHEKDGIIDPTLDAGFILGYTLDNNYRKHIINTLDKNNSYRVFVDSNILNYSNPEHEWHRYSLNSVYPSTGIYFFGELDKTKWDTFSKYHNVTLKDWRINGNHILILCQRSTGWNLFGINQERWLHKTITKIRKHSERPIVIRMHPGDRARFLLTDILNEKYINDDSITVSQNENIKQDLENCWCTVGYNSTPNVVSVIEGIPSIVTDPENCWAADVCGYKLNTIENPIMPDKSEWIHKIANIHWSNDEVKSGKLWSHIKDYISLSRQGK